jgi:hypothetical protein
MSRYIVLSLIAAAFAGCASTAALGADVNYDDPAQCSTFLAAHQDSALTPSDHRRCVLAIATTYIEGEQNSIPPEQELLADDVSRHLLGTPCINAAGNRAKIVAAQPRSFVIAAIRNRRWTIDGNQAWILYDGYLKSDPSKPQFDVAERITVEKGLISEILVAAVAHPR